MRDASQCAKTDQIGREQIEACGNEALETTKDVVSVAEVVESVENTVVETEEIE